MYIGGGSGGGVLVLLVLMVLLCLLMVVAVVMALAEVEEDPVVALEAVAEVVNPAMLLFTIILCIYCVGDRFGVGDLFGNLGLIIRTRKFLFAE